MAHATSRWIIKRNCSASPGQLALVFASVAVVSTLIGAAFAAQGLWLVLPFVGLELVAVGAAFILYGRHAADYERIELNDGALEVERNEAGRSARWRQAAPWVRVEFDPAGPGLRRRARVYLAARDERVEVGSHLPEARRARLAQELRLALRAHEARR